MYDPPYKNVSQLLPCLFLQTYIHFCSSFHNSKLSPLSTWHKDIQQGSPWSIFLQKSILPLCTHPQALHYLGFRLVPGMKAVLTKIPSLDE